jgi:hypothetical protein
VRKERKRERLFPNNDNLNKKVTAQPQNTTFFNPFIETKPHQTATQNGELASSFSFGAVPMLARKTSPPPPHTRLFLIRPPIHPIFNLKILSTATHHLLKKSFLP